MHGARDMTCGVFVVASDVEEHGIVIGGRGGADEGAGLIGAVVGAIIVLAIYGMVMRGRSRSAL